MLATLLSGCRVEGMGTLAVNIPVGDVFDFDAAAQKISAAYGKPVTAQMLENIGKDKAATLLSDAEYGIFNDKTWLHATGYS